MSQKEIGNCALVAKRICSTLCTTKNRVHLSRNGASVHMSYSSGCRREGCRNCFAAVQLLLPWTLRAAGGGRGEVKRPNGMPLALCVRDTAAVLPTLLSSGDVLIMCLIPSFNPSASHLLPSPAMNKVFVLPVQCLES